MQAIGLSAQDYHRVLSPNELWTSTLQHHLDSISDKVAKQNYTAGYCIYDLTADSVLYRYNAQNMLKPASTQKLFVSIAALSTLGKDYQFKTYIYIDGNIRTDSNGHRYLHGDIYIRGGYDPTLKIDDIALIAEKINNLRIDFIDGSILVDNRVMLDMKGVKNVAQYFGRELCYMLNNKGIVFSSTEPYRELSEPSDRGWNLTTLYTPISEVLTPMLKDSHNTYAECMLRNLCDTGIYTWSYDNCKDCVRSLVKEAGGNTDNYTIIDGSGLSHDNKTTPELLIKILCYAYQNEDLFSVIYENLPIAGEDGTLSKRMVNGSAYKNVHAKTGTLNGVSTLAGYATASNGHQLAFAILVNDIRGISLGKALQDDICKELTRQFN